MPEQHEIERVETYEGPPDIADLRWGPGRILQTRYGERRLSKARWTPEFELEPHPINLGQKHRIQRRRGSCDIR